MKYSIKFYDRVAKAKNLNEYPDGCTIANLFRLEITFNKFIYDYRIDKAEDRAIDGSIFDRIVKDALKDIKLSDR